MQVAFYLAGEKTQVLDAIPWVRCASGNVLKDTLIHPQSAHTLPDKSKRRTHDGHTLNFLMYVCLIVCKCSSSSSKTQHACMNPNMYDCFTMQSVLWPNAPINGGWAVLFTA